MTCPSGLSDVYHIQRYKCNHIMGSRSFYCQVGGVSICRTSPSSSGPLQFSLAALTHLLHQILTDRRPFLHNHCCILSQCVGFCLSPVS
ncbi:hypothetical protein GDO81_020062 [Engystomops pustulosus]|uniref:Uncharacterized protein n=1 Tax=Engystomops pustulosus TaxID=76066 RepID=A0AAV6ZHD1_ENGPU|nr:hypothetical protein GDO81_020062 [Engystomops pustulosus]